MNDPQNMNFVTDFYFFDRSSLVLCISLFLYSFKIIQMEQEVYSISIENQSRLSNFWMEFCGRALKVIILFVLLIILALFCYQVFYTSTNRVPVPIYNNTPNFSVNLNRNISPIFNNTLNINVSCIPTNCTNCSPCKPTKPGNGIWNPIR